MRPFGWDERDYKLWSEIQVLPSYGLLHSEDHMISFKAVVRIMEEQAKLRAESGVARSGK